MHKVRACSSLVCAGLLCLALLQPQPAAAAWPSDPLVNVPICTAASTQDYPVIVSDGAGGAIIAWHDYRRGGSDADIYARRVSATGTVEWTVDGVALCTATGRQELPAIASDGAGGAIVAWRDLRNGATNDIYAQRISVDGTVQWTPDGVALCTAADEQAYPTIVSDGAGGAIVTWHDRRSGDFDIYAQRISAGGSVQWAANGVPLCTAVGDQAYPTIVPDGANGAVIAWYDYRGGPYSDIYVQRIAGGGTVQWTPNGVPLCVATGNQSDPAIASDGEGGAIVTWYDERSGTNSDIYAQRVSAAGAVQWTTDGVALCVATGRQYGAVTVADGAGGAIVAWSDERGGGSNADLYSQRISADGAVHWTANGVALCTATADQKLSTIAADGAGGAIITWSDNRSGNDNIYAQRVRRHRRAGRDLARVRARARAPESVAGRRLDGPVHARQCGRRLARTARCRRAPHRRARGRLARCGAPLTRAWRGFSPCSRALPGAPAAGHELASDAGGSAEVTGNSPPVGSTRYVLRARLADSGRA